MPTVYLTRIVEFDASHRIARADWTAEQNARTFGKAAQDHAHRYQVRVTVKGPLAATDGGIVSLQTLDALLAREITDRLAGRHVNRDIPEFAAGMSTRNRFSGVTGASRPSASTRKSSDQR